MKNIKQFFTYVVVGALVMALSISCKTNEDPTDNTHSNHPPSGTYSVSWGGSSGITATATVTTSGGTCNIIGTAYNQNNTSDYKPYNITITKWNSGNYVSESDSDKVAINSPDGITTLLVNLINDDSISVYFELNGIEYTTRYMTRQQ